MLDRWAISEMWKHKTIPGKRELTYIIVIRCIRSDKKFSEQ
jgi:hypothetical protein